MKHGRNSLFRLWLQKPYAFTLIEMLLVVSLIAILSAGFAVTLKGRQDAQALRISAQDLAEALRLAVAETRLTGRAFRVSFTADRQNYRVESWDEEQSKYLPVEGMAGLKKQLANGVSIDGFSPPLSDDSSDQAIVFGVGEISGSIVVTLKNRAGSTAAVQLIFDTGQVNVKL